MTRIQREIHHFRSMPETARRLSISYFLRSTAYPLISLFTSAYIWQTNKDLTLLILYYIGNFVVLPPVFIANQWLLRHIPLKKLYATSVVMTGISSLMVVFYRSSTPHAYIFYGILYGLANGIYWANRNFLTLRHTTPDTRSYFTGLQFTLGTIASVIVPFFAGWIIVLTVSAGILPSTQIAYEALVGFAFILLVLAGYIIRGMTIETPVLTQNNAKPFSRAWQRARLLSIALGCADAPLYILPTVLVLQTLGNEAVLGSVSSIMAAVTAGITYVFGRKYRQQQFYPVFISLLLTFMLSGLPLFWGIGPFAVLWYIVIANLTDNLIWTANEPKIMDMMDNEVRASHSSYYRIIIDREWCVNIGRVGMYGIFLGLALVNQTLALQVVASLSGLTALLITLPTLKRHKS
ncbi:MAG: MFS transporter [Patescibacteria group bacterium]